MVPLLRISAAALAPAAKLCRQKRRSPPTLGLWRHELVFGLSDVRCTRCYGSGVVPSGAPCGCVTRKIFRICAGRYLECRLSACHGLESMWQLWIERQGERWKSKALEYCLDFDLIARRSLSVKDRRILYEHLLGEEEGPRLAAKMGMTRGYFFHQVYRIMQTLGKAFAECRPYPLYPLSAYFGA